LQDTIIHDVANSVDFDFFHNVTSKNSYISSSSEILGTDDRFDAAHACSYADNAKFASDAPFMRGCIRIGSKN